MTVKNTGHVAGKEVVQLYVGDQASSLPRPDKELKSFQKISLDPGESKTLTMKLDARALSYYNPYLQKWVANPASLKF